MKRTVTACWLCLLALPAWGQTLDFQFTFPFSATVSGDYGGLPEQDAPDGPEFGYSVATDGNWLAVGAPGTIVASNNSGTGPKGAVFLFRRSNGVWQLKQRILSFSYGNAPRCGTSIALKLPHLVIGCPGRGTQNTPDGEFGNVQHYILGGNGIWHNTIASLPLHGLGARCGTAVAITPTSGGHAFMAIGCPGYDDERGQVLVVGYDPGAPGNGWEFPATLVTASDGAQGDRFGEALAVYYQPTIPFGTYRLAVGAPFKNHNLALAAGSAYLFDGLGSSIWAETDIFTYTSTPQNFALTFFGSALAMNGSNLIIGVPGGRTTAFPSAPGTGHVHRYLLTDGSWQLVNSGTAVNNGGSPSGQQPDMKFGGAVAIGFDNWVAVAAPRADGPGQVSGSTLSNVGMVELRRNLIGGMGVHNSNHQGEMRPGALNSVTNGQFGRGVDFGARRLVVGQPYWRSAFIGAQRRGLVYIYEQDWIFSDRFEQPNL